MTALTAANQITLLRIMLVPAFVTLVVYGYLGWALIVFAIAGLTDAFDGLIARRSGQQSSLGAWLDPMADKLLLLTMFVMLTLPGLGMPYRLPLWLTVLVISRDVAIVLTAAVINLAVARRTFKPSILGKAATGIYIVTGIVALWGNYRGLPDGTLPVFVYLCLAITLISAADYLRRVMRVPGDTNPA
jgi:cardiolipin synthase